jgi:hypothetical protein
MLIEPERPPTERDQIRPLIIECERTLNQYPRGLDQHQVANGAPGIGTGPWSCSPTHCSQSSPRTNATPTTSGAGSRNPSRGYTGLADGSSGCGIKASLATCHHSQDPSPGCRSDTCPRTRNRDPSQVAHHLWASARPTHARRWMTRTQTYRNFLCPFRSDTRLKLPSGLLFRKTRRYLRPCRASYGSLCPATRIESFRSNSCSFCSILRSLVIDQSGWSRRGCAEPAPLLEILGRGLRPPA